jgi:hypothetical protein
MGGFHQFARLQPFHPITCDAMGLAFDTAWQKLLLSGTHLASSVYAEATREAHGNAYPSLRGRIAILLVPQRVTSRWHPSC